MAQSNFAGPINSKAGFKLNGTGMDVKYGTNFCVGSKRITHGMTTVSAVNLTNIGSTTKRANAHAKIMHGLITATIFKAWGFKLNTTSSLSVATNTGSFSYACFGSL